MEDGPADREARSAQHDDHPEPEPEVLHRCFLDACAQEIRAPGDEQDRGDGLDPVREDRNRNEDTAQEVEGEAGGVRERVGVPGHHEERGEGDGQSSHGERRADQGHDQLHRVLEGDRDAEDELSHRPDLEEGEKPEDHQRHDPSEENRRQAGRRGDDRLEESLPAVTHHQGPSMLERNPQERHQHGRHKRVGLEVGPPALTDDRHEDDREERRREERHQRIRIRPDDPELEGEAGPKGAHLP